MAPKFRFDRKQFGLTWSCPTDKEQNPIVSKEQILEHLKTKGELKHYTIGCEKHQNGKKHYHALAIYHDKLESTRSDYFNVAGCQCNVQNRGMSWDWYPQKDGDFITSTVDPYAQALSSSTTQEAMEILYKKRPRDMVLYGTNIERNLCRKLEKPVDTVEYYGPYPQWLYPSEGYWNPHTHALLIRGKPGLFKTSFAIYLMKHTCGECEYIKGASHERGKYLSMKKPFVWDELNAKNERCPEENSKELCDVERGGEIQCRMSNYVIPPLPRIFVSNKSFPFHDCDNAVFGRRLKVWPEQVILDSSDIGADLNDVELPE